MSEIDKRNRLSEEPFAYQIIKNGTVAISYRGKQIKIVKDKEAERLIAKILVQVHDELLVEVKENQLEEARSILYNCMKHAADLKVELEVDIHDGKDWYEAK